MALQVAIPETDLYAQYAHACPSRRLEAPSLADCGPIITKNVEDHLAMALYYYIHQ